MQIMDVYGQCVLVHPQVNVIFISFSSCLGAWEQQTLPWCNPAPFQAHPPIGTPSPHPLVHFPINIPILLLIGVDSHSSWFAAGNRQWQDAACMFLDFCTHKTSGVSTSQELPRALPFSLWSSRRMTIPSSRWCDPAVLSPFTPTLSSSSDFSAPAIFQTIGWNCSSWFSLKDLNGCWDRSLYIVLPAYPWLLTGNGIAPARIWVHHQPWGWFTPRSGERAVTFPC